MVLSACFLGVILSVAEMLSFGERLQRQLRLVFSCIFIIGIFTPIMSGKISLDPPEIGSTAAAVPDYGVKVFADTVRENISAALEGCLKSNGIAAKKISPDVNISAEGGIIINEVSISCPAEDRERAAELIRGQLGEVGVSFTEEENERNY